MPEIIEALTAAGVLLNTWLLVKLNGKFDQLEGRVPTRSRPRTTRTSTRREYTPEPHPCIAAAGVRAAEVNG